MEGLSPRESLSSPLFLIQCGVHACLKDMVKFFGAPSLHESVAPFKMLLRGRTCCLVRVIKCQLMDELPCPRRL